MNGEKNVSVMEVELHHESASHHLKQIITTKPLEGNIKVII